MPAYSHLCKCEYTVPNQYGRVTEKGTGPHRARVDDLAPPTQGDSGQRFASGPVRVPLCATGSHGQAAT